MAVIAIAIGAVGSGCGGPQERSTTIPPAPSARSDGPRMRIEARAKTAPRRRPPQPREQPPHKRPELVPGQLWGRRFVAVSFERAGQDPATVPAPHTHFSFGRTRFRGKGLQEWIGWDDGCNGYGGKVRVRAETMRVWDVAGSAVACMRTDKDGNPQVENGPTLRNFFPGTLHWHLAGPTLAITHGTRTLRLREVPR